MGAHYELVKREDKDPHSNYEMDSHSHVISITPCNPPVADASKPRRLLSLDVFRGLTVALMIFVDDIGGLIPTINHSPWDGVTLADFVMPFFLFIVGVSLGLTYKVKCGVRGDTSPACNSVGMVDRKILGIQHLYMRPSYRRTKQCSIDSPDNGSLPPDAPSWCQAPFDPEGILRSSR
ncbi:hypothetical protein Sjap_023137 [Stephania japonica]|uniref:Heparan-alpha-glucosaminide N-acetyltransferase n=1 Tax=Stephania japonica TaxID=461633 RepID=A0AAP0ED60_9MAGN